MTPSAPAGRDFVDFGTWLRTQREGRGLSVEDLARSTKIPPTLIGALEEGQSERFPEEVFILNYVRSYARCVGLEADSAVARFQAIPGAPQRASFDPWALEVHRRARAMRRAWWVAAATVWGLLGFALTAMAEHVVRFATR